MTTIKSVMIVEDEPFILDIYTEVLSGEGITVITAKNGYDALNVLENGTKVDLILLDIMMPRLSGLEFLETLHEKKLGKQNIILLTNLPDKIIIDHCYNLGALGMIMKSDITPGDLLPKINEILSDKQ